MFNSYTLAIVFALLTAVMWGLGPVLFKKSYEKVSAYFSYSFDGIFGGTILMTPFALSLGIEWSKMLLAILFTLPYSITYLMYLKAFEFERAKAGVVSVVLQTYPIFTIFVTLFLGHDTLKLGHYISILVIIGSTVLLAATEERTSFSEIIGNGNTKWLKFSLLTAVLIGVGDIILDRGIDLYSSGTVIMAIYITQLIIIFVLVALNRFPLKEEIKTSLTEPKIIKDLLGASACMTIGAIVFYLAFEYGPVQIVSPIAGIAPVFTIIAANYILNEKITKKEIALIGVILTYLTILTV